MKFIKIVALSCFLTAFVVMDAIAQSNKIIHEAVQVADEGKPIDFEMVLEDPTLEVGEVNLFYREKGNNVFNRRRMVDAGGKYTAKIPAEEVVLDGLEYYMSVILVDGQEITFPEVEPQNIPVAVDVKPKDDPSISFEAIILSPERNETVLKDDLLIAVSLFNGEGKLDLKSVALLLDGIDVTTHANITLDLISYIPYALESGAHDVELRLDDLEGNELLDLRWNFYVVAKPIPKKLSQFHGRLHGDSRFEQIGDTTLWRNKIDVKFDGNYGWLNYVGGAFITSDEQGNQQPRNRYFLSLSGSMARLRFGDTNPMFSNLVLRGKRVRGLAVELRSTWSSIDFVFGQTNRRVEGKQIEVLEDSIVVYYDYEYGTYRRGLLGIRTSLGNPEKFLLGFNLLKSKDDIESIKYGIKPKDNVVVGSDFQATLDDRRMIFSAEVAFSLYNDNIAGGSITKADLDTLGIKLPIDPKDFERYFVVNSSMIPLDPTTLSSLAYVAKLRLNYFKNLVNLNYKSIGSEYNCLENSYLQNDIRGFSIYDRIRLFNNQAYLMLGYENCNDNLSNDKPATTNSEIFSTSISYYPIINLPDINVSFRRYLRNNGISEIEIIYDSLDVAIDSVDNRKHDLTHIFSVNLGKPIYLFNLNHNLSLTYNQFDRIDKYNATRLDTMLIDNANKVFRAALRTQYGTHFTTTLSYSFNRSSSRGRQDHFNFDMLGLHTEYRLFNNRLRAHTGAKALFGSKTINSDHTDYNRFDFIVGGVYDLSSEQSILFDASLAKYTGETDDTDGIVRLGYVRRF